MIKARYIIDAIIVPTFTGVLPVVFATTLVPTDHTADVLSVLVLHHGVLGAHPGAAGAGDLRLHHWGGGGAHSLLSPDGTGWARGGHQGHHITGGVAGKYSQK